MRRETKPHVLFAALFVLGSLFAIALTAIGFNIDRSALVPYNLIFAPSVTGLRVHAPVRPCATVASTSAPCDRFISTQSIAVRS
jgi:hypothetical protein